MSRNQLAKRLSKVNGIDLDQQLELLKQRDKNIELDDYFTAFVMDKIRQDEFQACKRREWQEENNKLGGNEDEK